MIIVSLSEGLPSSIMEMKLTTENRSTADHDKSLAFTFPLLDYIRYCSFRTMIIIKEIVLYIKIKSELTYVENLTIL